VQRVVGGDGPLKGSAMNEGDFELYGGTIGARHGEICSAFFAVMVVMAVAINAVIAYLMGNCLLTCASRADSVSHYASPSLASNECEIYFNQLSFTTAATSVAHLMTSLSVLLYSPCSTCSATQLVQVLAGVALSATHMGYGTLRWHRRSACHSPLSAIAILSQKNWLRMRF
jgi:hypothetical protein